MGHAERQADRHAEELGRLADVEDWAEHQWETLRSELAAKLSAGATLRVDHRPVLDFDHVIDRICTDSSERLRAALLLSMSHPSLSVSMFTILIERAALALVDESAKTFKRALEKEYE